MLDVLDCLEETGIDIELAKEHFDQNLAPVKAWAARQELQARHDRVMMGTARNFEQGKAWHAVVPYGYKIENKAYVMNEDEAQWVRLVWEWYSAGLSIHEIRRRLIADSAKQREFGKHKIPWDSSYLQRMISAKRDYYHTGALEMTWDGSTTSCLCLRMLTPRLLKKVKTRLARYKAYPAGNLGKSIGGRVSVLPDL